MAVTATKSATLKDALNTANPNEIADALAQVDLGSMVAPTKVTVTQASASTVTLSPAALMVSSVRVTAGAAAAGLRQIGDAAATASATVAKLSDDGATLTFEAGVTGAVVVYMARSATDPSAKLARS